MLEMLFLAISAYTDWKRGKIYNVVILVGCGFAFLQILPIGFSDVSYMKRRLFLSFTGMIVGLLIGMVFYFFGVFRGGDGKLMMMIGAFAGIDQFPMEFAWAMVGGGVFAFFLLIKHRLLIERMKRIGYYFEGLVLQKKFKAYQPVEKDPIRMPFAVSTFFGILVYKVASQTLL
ncbi:MAG: A24 family peptidase [Oribacterium sp.]|nr:A24 family peptidase [Oribacterium sp.]